MKGKKLWKGLGISVILVLALLIGYLVYPGLYRDSSAKTTLSFEDYESIIGTYNIDDTILSYKDYLEAHKNAAYPDAFFEVGAENIVRYEQSAEASDPVLYKDYEGFSGNAVYTSEESLVEFEVNVPKTGFYNVSVVYYPVPGKNSEIERSIFVDGELPFKELSLVTFQRVWESVAKETKKNENGVTEKIWEYDNQGNDVKPESV